MIFAHIADTHLGYRQYNLDIREEDFYSTFHQAVDTIAERCDFVIHSGDLFDDPRPHVKAIVEVRDALEKLEDRNIPFFCIAGNHDILLRKGAVPPHRIFKNVEFLTPKNPWREYEGIFIAGLPYYSKIHINALKERLKEIVKESKGFDKKIIMLHQGIDKYFGLEYELKIGDIPEGFDYYALGHIHSRIVDTIDGTKDGATLSYPGSTDMWRVDELKDFEKNGKGFNIVDTSDFNIEKVDVSIRPFLHHKIESDMDITELKERLPEDRDTKPVLNIKVKSRVEEFPRIYQRLVNEFKEDVIYLDIKRERIEEDIFTAGETVDIKKLIENLDGFNAREKDFAYALFRELRKGREGIEGAESITAEFYRTWRPAP